MKSISKTFRGGHGLRGASAATGAGINANAAADDDVTVRNGRISGFWVAAVLKSGSVEKLTIDGVEIGVYVGTGAVVDNTISAAHTDIEVHSARVEGNAVEAAAVTISCSLSCFARDNLIKGGRDQDAADSTAALTVRDRSLSPQ